MYNFHKTYIKACNSKIKGQLYELRGLREARERSGTPGSYSIATVGDGDLGVWGCRAGSWGVRIRPGQKQLQDGQTDGLQLLTPSQHHGIPLFRQNPLFSPPSRKLKKRVNSLQENQTSQGVWSAMTTSRAETRCQIFRGQR